MDALILSCGTGGGHNSAARALAEELTARGHKATLLNPYTLKSERLASAVDNTYISIAQKTPHLFGVIYDLGKLVRKLPFPSPVYLMNALMAPLMREYLESHRFDVILMTHIFPAEIITRLKRQSFPLPKTVLVATDYTCVPFMEEPECDAYVIPSEKLMKEFKKRGVPPEKLYPLGIPVSRSFAGRMSRAKAAGLVGLDCKKRYILVSGGSIGAGNIKSVLKVLCRLCKKQPDTRIIAVCGSRSQLADKLRAKYGDTATIVDYTDKMAAYLSLCDMFLAKPGGLSSTEAAVLGVPLLHISPIPGCELNNLRFFRRNGMSLSVRKPKRKRLRRAVRKANKEDVRERMVSSQHQTVPDSARSDICDLAESLVNDGFSAESGDRQP